jgi:hypothetical protein
VTTALQFEPLISDILCALRSLHRTNIRSIAPGSETDVFHLLQAGPWLRAQVLRQAFLVQACRSASRRCLLGQEPPSTGGPWELTVLLQQAAQRAVRST